jgi:hypothetical protein
LLRSRNSNFAKAKRIGTHHPGTEISGVGVGVGVGAVASLSLTKFQIPSPRKMKVNKQKDKGISAAYFLAQ